MAKGQTKQATKESSQLFNQAPQTFSPVTTPLSGVGGEARSGYEELARTGGITGSDAANYFNAATRGIASTNSVLQEQLNRQRAAQGMGAGGGEYAELSRLSAQQTSDADLRAAVALNQLKAQGEAAGLAGLSNLDVQLLQALGLQTGSQEQAASTMAGLSKNPGFFGNVLNTIGAVSGAGSVSGGGGNPISWSV